MDVQKIACVNNAGFVMSFEVTDGRLSTGSSGNYPIDQTRTIDLEGVGFSPGDAVWPRVSAVLGRTEDGSQVTYQPNGQVATYEVKGTTLDFHVNLIS